MDIDEQPSTSKKSLETQSKRETEDYAILPPTIKDEEDEIKRLEKTKYLEKNVDDDRIAKIKFICNSCDMTEMVHYFGKKPPFVYGVEMLEDTYVMRDPFQPPPPRGKSKAEYFIAIGAHCFKCNTIVCKDSQCSFFYTQTFCLKCAEMQLKLLPPEVQVKLRKQLAAKCKN